MGYLESWYLVSKYLEIFQKSWFFKKYVIVYAITVIPIFPFAPH